MTSPLPSNRTGPIAVLKSVLSIRFDDKGDVVGNPYRLYEWDGNAFVEAH